MVAAGVGTGVADAVQETVGIPDGTGGTASGDGEAGRQTQQHRRKGLHGFLQDACPPSLPIGRRRYHGAAGNPVSVPASGFFHYNGWRQGGYSSMTIRELFGTGPDIQVASLATDSRLVEPGSVFFCVTGATVDGHRFASGAADRGAVCIVHSSPLDDRRDGTFYLRTDDVTAALNTAASAFYGHPSRRMTVFGVTGTNGKTTVATTPRPAWFSRLGSVAWRGA